MTQEDTYKQSGTFAIGHMSGGKIEDSKIAGVINENVINKTIVAQNYHNQGDTMSDKSNTVNINSSGDMTGVVLGDNTGVVGKDMTGVAGGNISGPVTISIGELAKSNTPEAPKIADLLKQLQTAIESEANLSDKDKTKALKQIQVLAEAGKNPQDEEKKGLAETAVDILKGVLLMEIPSLSGTVEVFKELLPLIKTYFGF
jgi:hypothetical protein